MPRDAQAMMVTLMLSGWVAQKGPNVVVSDASLDNLFNLSEQILLKAEARDRKREAAARDAEQRPPIGHGG